MEEKTNISRKALELSPDIQIENLFYRKSFKFFTNMTILKTIQEIIHLLSIHGNIDLLIDYLLEKLHQSSMYRKQSVLIINEVLRGCIDSGKSSLFNLILPVVFRISQPCLRQKNLFFIYGV